VIFRAIVGIAWVLVSAGSGPPAPNDPFGNAIVLDAVTGARDARFPIFRGAGAAASDGAGGFYVAARSAIVHVRSDGSIDPGYRVPIVGSVSAFARSGRTLYVSGRFRRIGGRPRPGLAAVDLRRGSVLPWKPVAGGRVLAVAGGNVIAGNGAALLAFDARDGRLRWSLVSDEANDGSVPAINGSVEAVAVAGGRLFASGAFTRVRVTPPGRWVRTGPRAVPIELDSRTGQVRPWRVRTSVGDEIRSLAAYRGALFVAGHGSGYRVELRSGRVLGPIRGHPTFVKVAGGRLFVGGDLRDRLTIPGRNNLAAIDLETGRLMRFDPELTRFQMPGGVIVSGRHVLVLGTFLKSIG
jgi:outer membrane protein assembly factor BamB